MSHHSGITRTEVVTLLSTIVAVVVLFVIFLPSTSRDGEPMGRTVCGTRLNGIYKAMNTYSVANRDQFPMVGKSDPAASAIGFAEGDRNTGHGATLDNNVTAALWMLVRDGSTSPQQFISPTDKGAVADPITGEGATLEQLVLTHDFSSSANLSYSVMNLRHPAYAEQWGPYINPEWVLMADDNDNNSADRHIRTKGADSGDVQRAENSASHTWSSGVREGQHVMLGDGHVSFEDDPFVGPGGDNIYAMIKGGKNAPPTLGNSDGDAATDPEVVKRDVVLLPITGNGGGAGSLDPSD